MLVTIKEAMVHTEANEVSPQGGFSPLHEETVLADWARDAVQPISFSDRLGFGGP